MINDNPLLVLTHSLGGDTGTIASRFLAPDTSSASLLLFDAIGHWSPQVERQFNTASSSPNQQAHGTQQRNHPAEEQS